MFVPQYKSLHLNNYEAFAWFEVKCLIYIWNCNCKRICCARMNKLKVHFYINWKGITMKMVTRWKWSQISANDALSFWLLKKSVQYSINLTVTQMNMITNIEWCTDFLMDKKIDAFFHPINRNTNKNDHKHWMMYLLFWWTKKTMHFSIHFTGTHMKLITNIEWCTYFFDSQNINAFFHPLHRHTDENDHNNWMM